MLRTPVNRNCTPEGDYRSPENGELARRGLSVGLAGGRVQLSKLRAGADELNLNGSEALFAEAEHMGGSVGEINDAILGHRAAVIHAHHNGTVVPKIGDAEHRAERKSAMRTGERVFVKGFTTGSGASLKESAVPRSNAELIPMVTGNVSLICRCGGSGMLTGSGGLGTSDAG